MGDNNHIQHTRSNQDQNANDEMHSLGQTSGVRRQGSGTQVLISRAPFTQVAFDELHLRQEKDDNRKFCQKVRDKVYCSRKRLWRLLTGYLPVIKVIRYYKLKESAINDIFAGLSVGTVHIPQALAFGLLASVKIENGLFTSLWPVLIYVFFGTSAHVTMGPSAVICILTATIVDKEGEKWAADQPGILNQTANGTLLDDLPEYLAFKEELAMGVTLITGIIMVVMGFLKLGFITMYLSDSFFTAFTSAAAVHIGASQLPSMLGITIPRFGGIFKIIKTFEAIFDELQNTNSASIIIALICCGVIWFVKEQINEKYKKNMPAPIPIELFVVIFSTVASSVGKFQDEYKIEVVGKIPTGIPKPFVPTEGLKYANNYIVDCFVMAVLIFAFTIAIAKILAKKHNYEVDNSQEMLAYGFCNLGSSFLRCIPSCVAPPRSMVASSMNAKTTINGIFSAVLMLLIILVVAQLFNELPKSVLGAIIFISLKNLFIQIRDFRRYWRINKLDFVIWFFTFFGTVFLDIDIGLGVGVGVSVLTIVFQNQFARSYKMGYTQSDPTLVEHKKYTDSMEVPGVKVFRYESSLYFANADIFRNALYHYTVNPRKLLKALKKREKRQKKLNEETSVAPQSDDIPSYDDGGLAVDNKAYQSSESDSTTLDIPATPSAAVATESLNLESANSVPGGNLPNGFGAVKLDRSGVRRVKVPSIEQPVFMVNGGTPVFLDDTTLGLRSFFNTSSYPTVVKPDGFGTPKKVTLQHSDTFVSNYSIDFDDYTEDPDDGDEMIPDEKLRQMLKVHHVIIDCTPVTYIDASGSNLLCQTYTEYSHVNIKLYLAGCSAYIRRIMQKAGVFDKIPGDHFFVDVHDAISFAKPQRSQPINAEQLRDFSDEEAIGGSRMMNG